MTDQTRADFEAHFGLATRQKWQHKDGSYQFPEIQAKWEGYLAGVAKAAPVAVPEQSDSPCIDADGCPTELAVLKRFWRAHQAAPDGKRVVALEEALQLMLDRFEGRTANLFSQRRACENAHAVLAAAPVAAAAPGAVPQTDLQREIARDAEAFEATLTERPARESSLAYPWGWRYVSNEVQGQFRDWCCRHPK